MEGALILLIMMEAQEDQGKQALARPHLPILLVRKTFGSFALSLEEKNHVHDLLCDNMKLLMFVT